MTVDAIRPRANNVISSSAALPLPRCPKPTTESRRDQPVSLKNRTTGLDYTLLKTVALGFLMLSGGRSVEATIAEDKTIQLSSGAITSIDGAQLNSLALVTAAVYNEKSYVNVLNSSSFQNVFSEVSPFNCTENSISSLATGGYVVFGIDSQNRVIYQTYNGSNSPGTILTASTSTNTNVTGLTCTRSGRVVVAWWADGYIRQRLFFNNAALTPSSGAETNTIAVSSPTRPYLFSLSDPWGLVYSNGTQVISSIYSATGFSNSIIANSNSSDTCVSPCGCMTTGGHVIAFAKIDPQTKQILGYYFRRNNNLVNLDTTDQLIASGPFGTWDEESQIIDVCDNGDGTFTLEYAVVNGIYQVVVNSSSAAIIESPSPVTDEPFKGFSTVPFTQEGKGRWAALWSNATGLFSRVFSRISTPTTTTTTTPTTTTTTTTPTTTTTTTTPTTTTTTTTPTTTTTTTTPTTTTTTVPARPTTTTTTTTTTPSTASTSTTQTTTTTTTPSTASTSTTQTTRIISEVPTDIPSTQIKTQIPLFTTAPNPPYSLSSSSAGFIAPVVGVLGGLICLTTTAVAALIAKRWLKNKSDKQSDGDMPMSPSIALPETPTPLSRTPSGSGTHYEAFTPPPVVNDSRMILKPQPRTIAPLPLRQSSHSVLSAAHAGGTAGDSAPVYNNISTALNGAGLNQDDEGDPSYNNIPSYLIKHKPGAAIRGGDDEVVYVNFSALSSPPS